MDQGFTEQDFIAQLGPEGLQQLMALAGLGDQQEVVSGQLAQAQALRKPGPERYGAQGSMFQALADGVNTFRGYRDESALRGQQQGLMGQRDAARQKMGAAYAASQAPPQALQPPAPPAWQPPDLMPPIPFALR